MSVVRGTGRQTLGAVIIFVSFYIFALPVGIPLMFATKLGLSGQHFQRFTQHLNLLYFLRVVMSQL